MLAAQEYFTEEWAKMNGCTKADIPLLCRVANLVTDMVKQLNPDCSCCKEYAWPQYSHIASQVKHHFGKLSQIHTGMCIAVCTMTTSTVKRPATQPIE